METIESYLLQCYSNIELYAVNEIPLIKTTMYAVQRNDYSSRERSMSRNSQSALIFRGRRIFALITR